MRKTEAVPSGAFAFRRWSPEREKKTSLGRVLEIIFIKFEGWTGGRGIQSLSKNGLVGKASTWTSALEREQTATPPPTRLKRDWKWVGTVRTIFRTVSNFAELKERSALYLHRIRQLRFFQLHRRAWSECWSIMVDAGLRLRTCNSRPRVHRP